AISSISLSTILSQAISETPKPVMLCIFITLPPMATMSICTCTSLCTRSFK
ncbi:hypothetical protein COCVIDRAFT_111594, partial [Bipolaris victoriae FI3]